MARKQNHLFSKVHRKKKMLKMPNFVPLWWNHKIHNAHLDADKNPPTSRWTSKTTESEMHSDMYFRFADLGCPSECWGTLICLSMGVMIFMVPPQGYKIWHVTCCKSRRETVPNNHHRLDDHDPPCLRHNAARHLRQTLAIPATYTQKMWPRQMAPATRPLYIM